LVAGGIYSHAFAVKGKMKGYRRSIIAWWVKARGEQRVKTGHVTWGRLLDNSRSTKT
jgi:hypothetical protein